MSQQSIDGLLLKEMVIAGANLLEQNREAIDALNVFPVPDGFQMLEAIADSADASWEEHDRRLK